MVRVCPYGGLYGGLGIFAIIACFGVRREGLRKYVAGDTFRYYVSFLFCVPYAVGGVAVGARYSTNDVGSGLASEIFGATFELALDMFLIWHT